MQSDPTSLSSPNPENKLFVGGAPPGTDENTLQQIFSEHGEVEEVFVMRGGSRSGQACAFVRFTTAEGAVAAIQAIHGKYIMPGCTDPLVVRYADAPGSRVKKGGNGSGGGRSFNGYGGGSNYPPNNFGGQMGGGWGGPYGGGNAGWGGAPFPGFMPYGAMGSAAAAMGGTLGGLGGMGGMGNQMGNMNGMNGMGIDANAAMGGPLGGGLGMAGAMPLAGMGGMPGPMGTMGGTMGGMNGGAMGSMAQGGVGPAGMPLMSGGDGAFGNQNGAQDLPPGMAPQQALPHTFPSGDAGVNGGASPAGARGGKPQPVVSGKPVEGNTDWAGYTAPDGRTYYYNGKTGVSTWEKPAPTGS